MLALSGRRVQAKAVFSLVAKLRSNTMPKGYHHLTRDQRCQIAALISSGILQKNIAIKLGVSKSTISRELRRNQHKGSYEFHVADVTAVTRRWVACIKPRRMTPILVKRIENHLQEDWSPEQIAGRLKREKLYISHESIYRYIWKNKKNGGNLYKYLRHFGKTYKKRSSGKAGRGCIPNRVDIKERPFIVETKERIGDWEGDTIVGSKHKGAILSYVDRKTKYTILEKLKTKSAENVIAATLKRFSELPFISHTITYDNGKEFSSHELIKRGLGIDCYFATPYRSWERALNEHTNGLVRQYIPKKCDFKFISSQEVQYVENRLNNRPRKVLGYLKPKEMVLLESVYGHQIALQS